MKTMDRIRRFLHLSVNRKSGRGQSGRSLSDIMGDRGGQEPGGAKHTVRRSEEGPVAGSEKERLEEVVQHEPNYDPVQEALDAKAAREHERRTRAAGKSGK